MHSILLDLPFCFRGRYWKTSVDSLKVDSPRVVLPYYFLRRMRTVCVCVYALVVECIGIYCCMRGRARKEERAERERQKYHVQKDRATRVETNPILHEKRKKSHDLIILSGCT